MPTSPQPSGLVNYKILAGSELSGEFAVHSIDVYKEVNRIPTAIIRFTDGNAALQKFELSEKANVDPGKDIEIKAGFDTDAKTIFKGMITRQGVKATQSGSFLIIECKDKAVKMTVENRSEVFQKKKDSDIIKTHISKYGLIASVGVTTYLHPQILQYDSNDWDFCVSRAELNGMLVAAYDNKVQVQKPKVAAPKLILEYGTNLLEFEADIDAVSQLSKVTSNSWDVKTQKITKNVVSSATFTEAGSLKSATLAGKVKKEGYSQFHAGAVATGELKDWGTATMLRSKMAKYRGRLKFEGYADINPGDTVEIKGVGKKFNGKVYVSAVRHDLSGGHWFTHVQFGLSPEFHSQRYDTSQLEASGLIPAVHGLQVGKVKKIHGDPEGLNRLLISLPVFGSQTDIWARQAFADAGNQRGVYFVPEVNDEVIVGFLNEDARFPVVLGTLHSTKFKPPYTTAANNKEKGITTRSKMKMTFNDVDKIVTIETPAKNSIELNDKAGTIVIKDKSSNTITMKSGLIDIKGQRNIKITAPGNIDMKATGNVNISGTKVSIKGTAQVATNAPKIDNTATGMFSAKASTGSLQLTPATAQLKGVIVQIQGMPLVKIN